LAELLKVALGNSEVRAECASRARQFVMQEFSPDQVVMNYIELIRCRYSVLLINAIVKSDRGNRRQPDKYKYKSGNKLTDITIAGRRSWRNFLNLKITEISMRLDLSKQVRGTDCGNSPFRSCGEFKYAASTHHPRRARKWANLDTFFSEPALTKEFMRKTTRRLG